ncbi:MAG: hypothetical protein ACOX5Z_10570 [Desulfobulbus sp.]|jgi:hypothetical protein
MHTLPASPLEAECRALMRCLRRYRRIDWQAAAADPRCSTEGLFGPAGGKMFGLLACRNAADEKVVLRAFSGQYNGLWQVAGWVGPIFAPERFAALVQEPERAIKELGWKIEALPATSPLRRALRQQRRQLSRRLMTQVHDLYRLTNFRGETLPLTKAFLGAGAPPAGTGDCCAPKLLHHAVCHNLRPYALAEWYWGSDSASGLRSHGCLYPACAAKCQPLLGFLLCGLS